MPGQFFILAEENYLTAQHPDSYPEFLSRVNRVIPRFSRYRKNRNPFNLKKVIFKEKDSVFNMLVMFLLVLLYKEYVFYRSIPSATLFIITGSVLILLYIIVKIIKNRANRYFL